MKEIVIHFDSIRSTYINYTTNTTQNILNSGYIKFTFKNNIHFFENV